MFLYGFNIYSNNKLLEKSFEDNKAFNTIEINYHRAPCLNANPNLTDNIQHHFLPEKTIIYNKKGQLLEVTKNTIDLYSQLDITNEDMEYIMFTSAFPYLLRFNDQVALHGTAITYGKEAIILLGKSGSWKSTLSFALTQKLCENIISDDLIVLSNDNQYIFRGISKLRLFESNFSLIKQRYGKTAENEFYIAKSDDKISVSFSQNYALLDKYKIRCIYILNNNILDEPTFANTDIQIEKKRQSFLELFQNIKCWQAINHSNIACQLKRLQEISKNSYIRVVSFNSIKNRIETNIFEVVESISKDIIGSEKDIE